MTKTFAVGEAPRLLVVGGIWPHVAGNREAAEVVTYLVLQALAASGQFDLRYACVTQGPSKRTEAAAADVAALEEAGVRFLPPVELPPFPPPTGKAEKWWRMLVVQDHRFLEPGAGHWPEVAAVLGDWQPQLIATVWSEIATCAVAGSGLPSFHYYGNPPFKTMEARLRLDWRFERRWQAGWLIRHLLQRLTRHAMRRRHLEMMRGFAGVGQLAANDADLYRAEGVKRVFYLQNIWPSQGLPDWQQRRDAAEILSPLKIAANVGNLSATGNTHGLMAVVQEILPALKKRLGEGTFELHVFGGGAARGWLDAVLRVDPHVRIRGFVDDIDGELLSCPIFLMPNNRYGFKVCHTRFLHAWSLGACCVSWADSRLPMPEIEHGKNALLAETPEQMAEAIATAAKDKALRRRLGENGMGTLRQDYSTAGVTARIIDELKAIAGAIVRDH